MVPPGQRYTRFYSVFNVCGCKIQPQRPHGNIRVLLEVKWAIERILLNTGLDAPLCVARTMRCVCEII